MVLVLGPPEYKTHLVISRTLYGNIKIINQVRLDTLDLFIVLEEVRIDTKPHIEHF